MKHYNKLYLQKFILTGLRRLSYKWPPRTEALKKARVTRGIYKCAQCEDFFGRKEIQVDHIKPVIPITGFKTFDDVIKRMFCKVSGFQVLCKPCHKIKTDDENKRRKRYA